MNESKTPRPIEDLKLVTVSNPDTLTAQKNAIDAASVGGVVFHSAAAYLVLHPKIAAYKR
jgi:hypothetical protein